MVKLYRCDKCEKSYYVPTECKCAVPDAAKNTLVRRDIAHKSQRFTGDAITGFGELPNLQDDAEGRN